MDESASGWPLSLRLLHWASAAVVLAALGLGATMVQLVHDPAARFELTQTHKSIGVAVLALTAVRLCRRILTAGAQPRAHRAVGPHGSESDAYCPLRFAPADASVGLADGNDYAGTRANRGIRAVRAALSFVAGLADLCGRE